jgi:type I restriction enzyme R subunit
MARGNIRPDIVLFVNGIPFGVIECKRASIDINKV